MRRGTAAFDVILVEALDRLARDQEDLAGLWKRLNFLGIELRAVHDGKADQIQIGIRGLVGALYLQDLAHTVALHPTALVRYRQQVEDLQKALSSDSLGDDREPVRALRELVAACPRRRALPLKSKCAAGSQRS